MIILSALNQKELQDSLQLEKPFIAKQICQWIYKKGIRDFSLMTNLPKPLRDRLSKTASVFSTKVKDTLRDTDGTVKLQIELLDGSCVECVLLVDKSGRRTACLSSQVGCAMGCAFCKTGSLGFSRNLSSAEIIEQFLHLTDIAGADEAQKNGAPKSSTATNSSSPISNAVFMGMGEPLLNLENVKKAIDFLCDKDTLALSKRRFTISTSGIPQGIIDIADNMKNVGIALSLVTADSDIRSRLMKVNITYGLSQLQDALSYYLKKTGNRITFEAVLLDNINTSAQCAKKFIEYAKSVTGGNLTHCVVNLIPWNPIDNFPFQTPDIAQVRAFSQTLTRGGLNVTVRYGRGAGVAGSCGQLGVVNA